MPRASRMKSDSCDDSAPLYHVEHFHDLGIVSMDCRCVDKDSAVLEQNDLTSSVPTQNRRRRRHSSIHEWRCVREARDLHDVLFLDTSYIR